MSFTHFNQDGRAHMVDVSDKPDSGRRAVAKAAIRMQPQTLALIQEGRIGKGDVLGVAQVAGIMGAKQTSQLIPMCHPLLLTGVDIAFDVAVEQALITITAAVKTTGKTGVEMEALTAAATAALTIYDMCKAVDRSMVIEAVYLAEKLGGKSGTYVREGERDV